MSPKRNKLKAVAIANALLLGCVTLGDTYAQGSVSNDDSAVEEFANDDAAVQDALDSAQQAYDAEKAEKAAAEKIAAEKAAAEEKLAAEKAEAEAAEKAAADEAAAAEDAIAQDEDVADEDLVTDEDVADEDLATDEVVADEDLATDEVAADEDLATDEVAAEEPVVEEPAVETVVEPKTELEKNEIARREGLKGEAAAATTEGEKLLAAKKYKEAISQFTLALNEYEKVSKSNPEVLTNIEEVNGLKNKAYSLLVQTLEVKAVKSMDAGDLQAATAALEEAKLHNPEKADLYSKKIDELAKKSEQAAYIESIKAKTLDPDKETRDAKIKRLTETAKLYMRNRRFEEAKFTIQSILRLDMANRNARVMQAKVQRELEKLGKQSKARSHREAINQVTWAWTNKLPKVEDVVSQVNDGPKVRPESSADFIKMQNKLDNIIIKNLNLKDATVEDVIALLILKSKQFDTEYHEGVNIILNAHSGSKSAAPALDDDLADDDFGGDDAGLDDDFGGDDLGGDDLGALAPAPSQAANGITITIDKMPLRDVLNYVIDAAGLKMRVDKYAIIVARELEEKNLQTRYFNVSQAFVKAVAGMGGSSSSAPAEDDGFGFGMDDNASSGSAIDSKSLQAGFETLGVTFSSNAKATYSEHISKLIVTNTAENLNKVQQTINQLNVGRPLINIESKFVEVIQTDLEELGFEWMLTNNQNFDIGNINVDIKGSDSSPQDFTSGLSKLADFVPSLGEHDSDILSSTITIGGAEFKNVIRALDQKKNTDVLFAPEVTTLSGEEAVLKSVTERYFPENWTEPEPGNGGNNNNNDNNNNNGSTGGATPSVPEFGDKTELGVTLTVTPTVTPGSREIELQMDPSVTSFVGYDEEIQIPFEGGVTYSPKMPIILKRSVQTKVICDDGETIVLGGLIKETVVSFEDRVPLLADIPLLGKLFTSEGESSEKANLLIFVTARLVDSAGRKIKDIGRTDKETDLGKPNFRY